MINRRDFLSTLAAMSFVLATNPKSAFSLEEEISAQTDSSKGEQWEQKILAADLVNGDSLPSIFEFADYYLGHCLPHQQKQDTVNILYPGGGYDLAQLALGLKILWKSPVSRVNFVYTEIGDVEKSSGFFGFKELNEMIDKEMAKYPSMKGFWELHPGNTWIIDHQKEDPLILKGLPSYIRKNDHIISQCSGTCAMKKINFQLCYNTSKRRPALNAREKAYFSKEFMAEVRSKDSYWSQKLDPKGYYPSYARTEQFSAADIILSHQCGDFNLLQFDYLRALLNPRTERKQRVILTDNSQSNYALQKPLPHYELEHHPLQNGKYGYSRDSRHSAGVLIFSPR